MIAEDRETREHSGPFRGRGGRGRGGERGGFAARGFAAAGLMRGHSERKPNGDGGGAGSDQKRGDGGA